MLQILKNDFRKKVAILLIVCLTFCTNSFNTLSTVYADDNETKVESVVKESSEETSKVVEETTESEKVSVEETQETTETEKKGETEEKVSDKVSTGSETEETVEPEDDLKIEEPEEDEEAKDLIATESEIEEILEDVATASEVDYMSLDAYNQFMYQDEDAVSYYDGTIILLKDIKLSDAIYFKEDATLDLLGHNITGPEDNYALYIENNFTLTNSGDTVGKVEGDNNEFPTIYIKNAAVEFAGGNVNGASGKELEKKEDKKDPANGGDAIHSYDSNLTFSGSIIRGGEGLKSFNDKGGDGGDALVVMSSLTSNTILVSSGGIVGGKGGDGYGDIKPKMGAAIKVGEVLYEGMYLGHGLDGNVGGGTGGNAINIKTDKFKSKNLTYEKYTISAGDNGFSTSVSKNEEMIKEHMFFAVGDGAIEKDGAVVDNNDLFGTGWTDAYYSLHDLNGQNYLTSLKYQNPTGLCTAFAMTAYAETNLIKKYPDYVRNVLNRNVADTLDLSKWHSTTIPGASSSDNANELNLSEMQFGMQIFNQPRDEFGNAGLSTYVAKKQDGSDNPDWENYGASSYQLSLTSPSWRSLVEEDNNLYWPEWGDTATDWDASAGKTLINKTLAENMTTLNSYTNKTVVHAKDALVRDIGYFYSGGSVFRRDEFLEQAKKDILKYNGFELFVFTCGEARQATFTNPVDPTNVHKYIKNGVDYGEVTSLDATPSLDVPPYIGSDLGGHALYCIGWDDDVEFDGAFGHYTGAFICKNSWHQFTLVPYDNAWGTEMNGHTWYADYMVVDFSVSFSEYENIYFYDTGTSNRYFNLDENELPFNVFKIKNDKEKIKAVSFYSRVDVDNKVYIYKVDSLTDINSIRNSLNNPANLKYTGDVHSVKGYNTFAINDDNFVVNKNEIYAVMIEGVNAGIPVNIDENFEYGDDKYTTVHQHKSYYTIRNTSGAYQNVIKFDDGANARIRLITNNQIYLSAFSDSGSGHFDISSSVWIDPVLRASLSYLPEPEPEPGKVFKNYNTEYDGTGTTYTTNSLYHLDIASNNLVLYAQYLNSTNNRTLTFDKNDASATGTMESWTRAAGTSVVVPTATYKKIGYDFSHWTLNDTTTVINVGDNLTLNDNTTLKAVWTPKTYHIDYELYGATFTGAHADSITYIEELDVPATASMTYVGHDFKGWYDNESFSGNPVRKMRVDTNDPKDLTYHAKWDIQKFTIGFNMHGHGTSIPDQSVNYGSKIVEPDTPVEESYAFMGWYTDDTFTSLWDFNTLIYADRTLHASWSEAINVRFDTDHGKAPATQYIVEGGTVTNPGALTVIGYDFIHWYENDENTPFDFSTIIRLADGATRTLHAKWNVKTYTVTLNVNGGKITSGNITSYTYGVGATLPTAVSAPSSSQYFAGWYESSTFKGSAVKKITATDYGDKTYYAKYEKQSGGDSPSRGGGSSHTGGSNTAGNVVAPGFNNAQFGPNGKVLNDTTFSGSLKTIPVTLDTIGSTWEVDANGNTHLVLKNANGIEIDAKNVFACVVTKAVDKNGKSIDVQDFYYLDSNGNMYTGWLRDTSNLNYYFNEEAGYDQGKLARGWTKIRGDYYYFDGTGNLQKSIITPDGFAVDASGKWLENAWQDGFINVNLDNANTMIGGNVTKNNNNTTIEEETTASSNASANSTNNSSSGGTSKKRTGKILDK